MIYNFAIEIVILNLQLKFLFKICKWNFYLKFAIETFI